MRTGVFFLAPDALAALGFSLALVLVGGGCTPAANAKDGGSKTTMQDANESWCPDGFESPPRSETCFAMPDHPTKDTAIVVYLHGLYAGPNKSAQADWDAAKLAVQRGFAVVLPRGKRALCAWSKDVKDQYCWPQDPEDLPTIKHLLAEWDKVLWQVDALLEGGGAHKRYVLGSDSGGAFATFITTHGLFPAQAVATVGGTALGAPSKGKAMPLMVLGSPEIHDSLAKASVVHASCPRSGAGAAITADDVDAALRFFKKDADGTLKPQGGAYPCEAKR